MDNDPISQGNHPGGTDGNIVRDEIAHRLAKGETLPEPAVRATRDLGFAAA